MNTKEEIVGFYFIGLHSYNFSRYPSTTFALETFKMSVMRIVLYILLVLSSNAVLAQQKDCNCTKAFESLVAKIENEYPGFTEKTMDTSLYHDFKEKLQLETRTVSNENCLPILKKYAAYFKDRHIWLLPRQQQQTAGEDVKAKSEILTIDIKKFKKATLKSTDNLEGIWKNESYEIGIKRINANEYVGFIISADPQYWKPKEIKFRLFGNGTFEYVMQDHSLQKGTYTLDSQGLLYFKEILTALAKQATNATLSDEEITSKVNALNGFYCKRLTSKTAILKLSNFSYPFVETIESLIAKHKGILQDSENLIIDLRGNGGGTTDAYQKLLPYIITNPIRHIGAEHLSTPAFIANLKHYTASIADREKNSVQIAENERRIKLLEANPGKFVNFSDHIVETDTIIPEPKSPRQVVFLTDNKVASAGEALLLTAKQSKKVKIMGIPTSGVLDYANAYFFDDFVCTNYRLLMPTFRSLRLPEYPIDNIGIQPDIYMDKMIADWEKYAVEYLENEEK